MSIKKMFKITIKLELHRWSMKRTMPEMGYPQAK